MMFLLLSEWQRAKKKQKIKKERAFGREARQDFVAFAVVFLNSFLCLSYFLAELPNAAANVLF